MLRGVLGAALLLGTAPVAAETYYATVSGVVTSEVATAFTAPGTISPIKVGDAITATFTYVSPQSVGSALGLALGGSGAKKAVFKVGGFTWTSAGDFMSGFEPISFDAGPDPLSGFYSTMDDAGGGDLHVDGYGFEIGEFGYDLYTGPGFKGAFDRSTVAAYRNGVRLPRLVSPTRPVKDRGSDIVVSPVPEPLGGGGSATVPGSDAVISPVPEPGTWALMIGGFGLAGGAARSRKRCPVQA